MTVAGSVLILDQTSKYLVQTTFYLYESIIVIDRFFSLTYVHNKGAAFSLFAGQSELFRALFFGCISTIAIIFLTVLFIQTPKKDKRGLVAIALLIGGALGNLADRVRQGEVIDFLDFYVGNAHWPIFNIADSAITTGVVLTLLNLHWAKSAQR